MEINGSICLVTGSTSGIGKVTARHLAKLGAQVIIHGREPQKAKNTVDSIKEETGNNSVEYLLADFTKLDQIRNLAAKFKENFPHLNILINNAGGFYNTRQEVLPGIEKTLLVNHLSAFLLTNLLFDTIKASEAARIVNVTSESQKYATMDFDDLSFRRGYFGMKAYSRSKLANVMFTYELATRISDTNVTVNAVHPGHVATDIWKTNFSVFGPILKWFMGLFAMTPEEGAEPIVYLATSPEVENTRDASVRLAIRPVRSARPALSA